MCNAWNHPKNCSCGWGGDGHSGRSSPSNSGPTTPAGWFISLPNTYDSYVNPNASCPVCGAAVFFYQSAKGGRVFFDELGPPWPKHPCTDNTSQPGKGPATSSIAGQSTTYGWQRAGWQPFIIELVTGIDKDYLKLSGISQGQHLSFYLRRVVEHHLHHQALSTNSLAQIRPLGESHYQLSILLPQGSPLTFEVFSLLAQARSGRSVSSTPSKPTSPGAARPSVIRPPKKQRHTGKQQTTHTSDGLPSTTAMALAFRKAQDIQGTS